MKSYKTSSSLHVQYACMFESPERERERERESTRHSTYLPTDLIRRNKISELFHGNNARAACSFRNKKLGLELDEMK